MEIKEYLQELLDKWNKYDELDGFMADSFRTDLENLLEYWDLRIIEEPVRVFYSGDMCVGSSNKPKKQQKRKRKWWKDKSGNTHLEATSVNAVKPKRQDEWKEEIKRMVLTDCFKDQPDIQGYIDFIEQLLSEKEKELLEWIISKEDIPQNVSSLWASLSWYEIYKEAHKRLSKLSKEENEDH